MNAVVALYNSKGGVGKTTSCVNLAWTAAAQGNRVLLWDLDPQGAASFYLKRDQGLDHKTRKLVSGKADWDDEVIDSPYANLKLIPADRSLVDFNVLLDEEKRSKKVLTEWLKPLRKSFEFILIDCPPGLTLISENVFRAADLVLVPVVPTPLSARTFDQLSTHFIQDQEDRRKVHAFLSMCDFRKKIQKSEAEKLMMRPNTFHTSIPLLAEVERMGSELKPSVSRASNRSKALYEKLWSEIAHALPEFSEKNSSKA